MRKCLLFCLSAYLLLFCFACATTAKRFDSAFMYHYYGKIKSVENITYEAERRGDSITMDVPGFRTVEKFNKQGKTTEILFFKEKGPYISGWAYTYNKEGRKTVSMEFDGPGSDTTFDYHKAHANHDLSPKDPYPERKTTFAKDPISKKSTVTRYNPDGTIKSFVVFISDENGNYLEMQEQDAKGNILENTVKKFDANNNEIQSKKYEGSILQYETNSTYDLHGNPVTVSTWRLKTNRISHTTYMYTYDKKNNWTERTSYVDNRIQGKEVQIIRYY